MHEISSLQKLGVNKRKLEKQNKKRLCITVQYYSTVQYSAVQCSAVQYSTVQYSTVQ